MKRRGAGLLAAWMFFLSGCQNSENSLGGGGGNPSWAPKRAAVHGEVGNGGHGVLVGGQIYLYDLFEHGVEHLASIQANPTDDKVQYFAERIGRKLPASTYPTGLLAAQIADIHNLDPLLAISIVNSIEMHEWHQLNRELRLLPVDGGIVRHEEGEVVLVANRRGRTIYMSKPLFQLMPPIHQAALCIHEAVYALMQPQMRGRLTSGETYYSQNSTKVRELVARLFTPAGRTLIQREGLETVVHQRDLPFIAMEERHDLLKEYSVLETFGFDHRNSARRILPQARFTVRFASANGSHAISMTPSSTPAQSQSQFRALCDTFYGEQNGSIWFELTSSQKQFRGIRFAFAEFGGHNGVQEYVRVIPETYTEAAAAQAPLKFFYAAYLRIQGKDYCYKFLPELARHYLSTLAPFQTR